MIGKSRIAVLVTMTAIGMAAIFLWHGHRAVGSAFFVATGIVSTAFVIMYSFSGWMRYPAGRVVMRLMACLAIICLHGTIVLIFGIDYPGAWIVRPALLLFVLVAITDMFLTFHQIQRDGRR